MAGSDNIATIKSIYEAFGKGDVATILDNVTDDVDWATDTTADGAPWYGVRHGKDDVAGFFQALGESVEVHEFTPLSFAADGDDVHTLVRFRASAPATGGEAAMNLHHYFRFREGKIDYYRGTEDVPQTLAMLGR